jgi:hypothetical protein
MSADDMNPTDYFILLAPHPAMSQLPARFIIVPEWFDTNEKRRCPRDLHLWAHLPHLAIEFDRRRKR